MADDKIKILIVDDQEGIRESLASILELYGYEVSAFEDGYKAIEKVKDISFDIAFIDIKMPGIDGVETFMEIKKITPETIVFMMTAYADQELVKKAVNEGAHSCLSKPLEIEAILEYISSVKYSVNIVLVGKEQPYVNDVKKDLLSSGYKTALLGNLDDACKYTLRKTPNLIIIDDSQCDVPALENLKNCLGDKCTKLILYGNSKDSELAKKSDKYLEKPFTARQIVEVI